MGLFKKVLILGNGFDLDIGLKTRYSDFVESDYWPFMRTATNPKAGLQHALAYAYCHSIDSWFDIEQTLEDYALINNAITRPSQEKCNQDRNDFNVLLKKLTEYLRQEQHRQVNKNSLAAIVLKKCIDNGFFDNIFSFNYTDLTELTKSCGVNEKFTFKHVHGNLNDGIVLGVKEDIVLRPGYEYLRKTFSHDYHSVNLPYSLDEADDVVFFGHSLSLNDYHYFDTFFSKLCKPASDKKPVHLTFFTKDYDSEIEIKKQLWNMNGHRSDRLYTYNDVSFILANELDSTAFKRFENRMSHESYKEYSNRLKPRIY